MEVVITCMIVGILARFAVPRVLVFVDSVPRNAAGKVLRAQLAAEILAAT